MKSIKLIGLAALSTLALIALPGVASASGGLEADTASVTLQGANKGPHFFYWAGVEEPTECSVALLSGSQSSQQASTVTATPSWSGCSRSVTSGGCKFEFHPGSENSFDIGPPGCGPWKAKVTGAGCTMIIGPQTGLPATYTNVGSGSSAKVRINATTNKVKYTREGGACGPGTYSDGVYYGEWELSAHQGGSPIGIRAADKFRRGFFLTGKKSENPAEQPKFNSEAYWSVVTVVQDAGSPFTFGSPSSEIPGFVCATSSYGEALIAEASAVQDLYPKHSSCTMPGQGSATLNMNSCVYSPEVSNSGPPYVGSLTISCVTGGDKIEISHPNTGCTWSIPPQTISGGVSLENVGSGVNRSVHVTLALTGIPHTRKGGACTLLSENASDGTISSAFTLQASET